MACFSTAGTSAIADHRAALLAELADQGPVGGVDAQRDLRLVVGQRVERREVGVGDQEHEGPGERPQDRQPGEQGDGEGEPA